MILVIGGTGLVGSHLLFHLLNEGRSVTAIHRKGSDLEKVKVILSYYTDTPGAMFNRIRWLEADISDIPALEVAFRGITEVYHCAALISFNPRDFKELQKVNVAGTANIVNLCIAYKVSKLCYVSSIAAIGKNTDGSPATEHTEWSTNEPNVYALSKHLAEMEVWRGSMEGLPVVIVNPGVIIGPGFWGKGSGLLFSISARGSRFYPPGGSGFITVNDVVRMMIQLMDSDIRNERFILIYKNLTYKEILSNVAREFGKNTPTKALKFWQLNLLWRLDWLRNRLTGSQRVVTKKGVTAMKNKQIYSNKKALKYLNYEFEMMAEAIYFSCNRFKESNPELFS